MEPSTQEGKSDKESESLIRRRPVVRQSLRKPKSQAAEAANNRRRALSGEREPQNNAEETTVKPTLKSKIPTHQSPSSHSKLSAMKPNLTDLLVPSESTKSSKKVTNGKLYDSKAKPKAHKSSSNNRNFSDEDIGSDISVESDVKRLMERQSKHIRQPSAATYTVSTKPASNSEHNKKAKDAEMVVKQRC